MSIKKNQAKFNREKNPHFISKIIANFLILVDSLIDDNMLDIYTAGG